MLPKEAIFEYQLLYQKVFGKKINFERATEAANKFIQLVMIIERETKDEYEKLQHGTKRVT